MAFVLMYPMVCAANVHDHTVLNEPRVAYRNTTYASGANTDVISEIQSVGLPALMPLARHANLADHA